MSIFSVVIAFFKDIPDVKGDKSSSIETLSVRLGVRFLPAAWAAAHTVQPVVLFRCCAQLRFARCALTRCSVPPRSARC